MFVSREHKYIMMRRFPAGIRIHAAGIPFPFKPALSARSQNPGGNSIGTCR